jgi:hypothetical protein
MNMYADCLEMTRSDHQYNQAHLSAEEILELAERGRRCPRYEEYIDHITECAVCRETYKQLLHAELTVRAARKRVWTPALRFWVPVAAAAMLVLFFGVWILRSNSPQSLALRQVNGVWYEGAMRLPDWAFAAAAQFERPPTPTTRDAQGAAPPAVRLIRPNPANAALESLTPEFRWERAPDAVRYRAWLEHADDMLKINLKVDGMRATLPEGAQLKAGEEYRLVIEALSADELAGEGLKAVYEFRTLTPEEQERLRWARTNHSQAPRACAVIFYQLGFYADALETLNALPNEPLIEQWRAAAQEQIRLR